MLLYSILLFITEQITLICSQWFFQKGFRAATADSKMLESQQRLQKSRTGF